MTEPPSDPVNLSISFSNEEDLAPPLLRGVMHKIVPQSTDQMADDNDLPDKQESVSLQQASPSKVAFEGYTGFENDDSRSEDARSRYLDEIASLNDASPIEMEQLRSTSQALSGHSS